MKIINAKIFLFVLACTFLLFSCKEDDLDNGADIVSSFKVKGKSGTMFSSNIGENTIEIKISPYLDAESELDGVTPIFYLSRGATVSPDPQIPQNFAQEGGVKYTVVSEDGKNRHDYTVTYGPSDHLPYGSGFSYAEVGTKKNFAQLGYPGEYNNFGQSDSKLYGDLLVYHAYCGDYIVLLSRVYADLNPSSPYSLKVVDKTTLDDAGSLNLGSISVKDLKVITSDYKGRCVGAVVVNNETEFFYWTKPSDAPKSIGKIAVNMASTTDGSSYLQVAGDITTNAWITALAPRGAKGEHYRIKVISGQLDSDYSIFSTGFSSGDCNGYQMISPLDDSDKPSFAVGDTEGTAGAANSVHSYIKSFNGITSYVMPPYWQNILQAWWVGTGFATSRMGGRTPVSALVINGKTYVTVTSGTGWWHAAAVLNPDLQSLAHENLNIAEPVNRGWSYGSWVDWYWNEDKKEAYLSVWFGRIGLQTYKLTCFE